MTEIGSADRNRRANPPNGEGPNGGGSARAGTPKPPVMKAASLTVSRAAETSVLAETSGTAEAERRARAAASKDAITPAMGATPPARINPLPNRQTRTLPTR
jgi:hypothetical protein